MSAPFRIYKNPPPPIVTYAQQQPDPEFKLYLDRLLKMIPAEIVSLYMIGTGFITTAQDTILVAWSVICFLLVFVVRIYATKDPAKKEPPQWTAIIISALAFVIWLYWMGGPFVLYPEIHDKTIASLLVLLWTFVIPIFYKGD